MTHHSGDSGHTGGDATHADTHSHDHHHDDSHNHHDHSHHNEGHNNSHHDEDPDHHGHHHHHHHHHHENQDPYLLIPPSYGSINAPVTRFTARRSSTYASNVSNATNATNEEEDARDRKIQNCVKVVFGLLFIGVLVCVFMAYQEGHGPGYGEYPPEWVSRGRYSGRKSSK